MANYVGGEEDDASISRTILAEACSKGDYELADQLIAAGSDPVTSRAGYFSWSPLHYAAKQGKLSFAQMLISQYGCHPMVEDKEGRTPLHVACQHGQLEFARYLVKQKRCDVHYGDVEELIPLYHACGWLSECTNEQALSVAKFLISSAKCDPGTRDVNGKDGVLHASEKGFISVLKYLIEDRHCDVGVVDYRGNNPIHLAVSFSNNYDVVKYLIGLGKLDLGSVNSKSNNLLHMAAIANSSLDICKLIVESVDSSTLESLVEAKNFKDETPLDMARPELLRYLLTRHRVKDDQFYKKYAASLGIKQPASAAVKIVVIGDEAAGKSTLVRSLMKESSSFSSSFSLSFSTHSQPASPTVVEQKTSAMAISDHKSKQFGEVKFHDLDGKLEAQYIHNVVLPHIVQPQSSIFLLVIDFSKSSKDISASLSHWLEFVQRVLKGQAEKAKIVLVASHSDNVKSEIKYQEPRSPRDKLKQLVFEDSSSRYEFLSRILMDCHKSESSGVNMLRKVLTTQCDLMRSGKNLPFLHSCLLTFIKKSFDASSLVSLQSLQSAVESYVVEDGIVYDLRYFVSDDARILVPLLEDLHQSGHLMFMKNEGEVTRSLLVPNVSQLCSELAEAFGGTGMTLGHARNQHGLLTTSSFDSHLLAQDSRDTLNALTHLNLAVTGPEMSSRFAMISAEDQQLYYCPSFLLNSPPNNMWDVKSSYNFHFGWRLERSGPTARLSMHYVHLLFLQLFSFATSLTRIKHFAGWELGLHFEFDLSHIEFLVELCDNLSAVVFIMRSKELTIECIKYRSEIVRIIRDSFKEYYGNGMSLEFIMDPYHSHRYPLMPRECLTLFSIDQVWHSIQKRKGTVLSTDDISLTVEELLTFEPLWSMSSDSLDLLQKVDHSDAISRDCWTYLADSISTEESGMMGKMFHVSNAESISPSGLQSALNSRQTYRDVLQILYNFTVIDLSLFHPQSINQSSS